MFSIIVPKQEHVPVVLYSKIALPVTSTNHYLDFSKNYMNNIAETFFKFKFGMEFWKEFKFGMEEGRRRSWPMLCEHLSIL
jgi:hypothetical protein